MLRYIYQQNVSRLNCRIVCQFGCNKPSCRRKLTWHHVGQYGIRKIVAEMISHIMWLVHNLPMVGITETFYQECVTNVLYLGHNQPTYRPERAWRQDGLRLLYGTETLLWRKISSKCNSYVKSLGKTKPVAIKLQDMSINLVLIS